MGVIEGMKRTDGQEGGVTSHVAAHTKDNRFLLRRTTVSVTLTFVATHRDGMMP